MKYISSELNKNYKKIIIIFLISYIGIIGFYSSYMYKNIKNQIRTVETFIKYEALNFKEEIAEKEGDIEEFFKEAIDESPKPDRTLVSLSYQGKDYFYLPKKFIKKGENLLKKEEEDIKNKTFENLLKESKNLKSSNKIRNYKNYKYKILFEKIKIDGVGIVELKIIKDMSKEYERLMTLTLFSILWLVLTFLIARKATKKFYIKFSNSIEDLYNSTNNINLNSIEGKEALLDEKLKFKNAFEEFNLIKNSYIEMLKRLNSQINSQIEFVNNASHELKTPLFIISGYIDMIKRWGIEDKEIVLEALSSIEDENKNMISLVEKLLFLAKDRKLNRKHYEEFNLSEKIKSIVDNLKIIYPNQIITLKLSKEDFFIFSDRSLLNQLVLNLLENAIKYGENNPIDISLEYDNNYIINIKDNGIGISKKDLEFIFDKFYRGDKSRNKETGGHGLGLTIVKDIVEFLKGEIHVESEVNKGTNIKIIIPRGIQKGVE